MAPVSPLLVRLREDTRGDHPSPEVSLVESLTENRFICALQFRQRKVNWQQVKRNVRVPELGPKTEHRVIDHHGVGFAQAGE